MTIVTSQGRIVRSSGSLQHKAPVCHTEYVAGAQYKRYIAACLFEDYLDTNERDPAVATLFLIKAVDAIIAWYFHDKRMFLPREKEKLELLRRTDATIAALVDRCLGEGTPLAKMPAALQLADVTIGVRGFFEWESTRERATG